jgi:hypothetical protein
MLFAFIYMTPEPPVHWSDPAVPGIIGIIGMTVVTGCLQEGPDTVWYPHHLVNIPNPQSFSTVLWRLDELGNYEDHQQSQQYLFDHKEFCLNLRNNGQAGL